MPSSNFADLPKEALHLIYSQLPTRQAILFSQTCQKARQAVASLPIKFKKDVTITMVNNLMLNAYGVCVVPARRMSSARRDNFENSFSRQHNEPRYNFGEIEKSIMAPRMSRTSRTLMDTLKPLLGVTSCELVTIITPLLDLVRLDWFTVLRYIATTKRQPFRLVLDMDTNSRNYCETIETLERSLHSCVEVARRVAFTMILWNLAKTGIRSVDIRFTLSYRLFSVVPLEWFSHLALWFIAFPDDFTKNSLRDFEKFVMKYLDGGFKGRSFNFRFLVPYGEEMKKRYNPFSAQLENIRKELGQSNRVCYHVSDTGVDMVWHTVNKAQYRVSWQGPVIEPKAVGLQMRVQGMIDSDDAVPRTRQLTPALQRQMDSAFRYTMGI